MAAKKKTTKAATRTPAELVAAYAREAAPLERRGEGGPEQLPAGAAILELDAAGRAAAAVAAYRALPRGGGIYGQRIMLGVLVSKLLKSKLPFDDAQIEAMALGAAHAWGPAWGPCDYDRALVTMLDKRGLPLNGATKAALALLVRRRGTKFAEDRQVVSLCERLAAR